MNNEEKILTLLEKLVTDVAELKADVSELKADVAELKAGVAELKADVSELKARVTKLENDFAEQKAELKAVQALQMQDYNLLLSIDKKVDKLSLSVNTHEKRFMKIKEALSA